jgi:hypothetical protein
MQPNPPVTLEQLTELLDQKLEVEARALKNAKEIFETDKIFELRILGGQNT